MGKIIRNLTSIFRRKNKSLENWQFLVPSYKRLNKDFLFMFKYELAKRSLTNTSIKENIDSITDLAETTLKEALFMNSKVVKKL
jgi:hypothetical protein